MAGRNEQIRARAEPNHAQLLPRRQPVAGKSPGDDLPRQQPSHLGDDETTIRSRVDELGLRTSDFGLDLDAEQLARVALRMAGEEGRREAAGIAAVGHQPAGGGAAVDVYVEDREKRDDAQRPPAEEPVPLYLIDGHHYTVGRGVEHTRFGRTAPRWVAEKPATPRSQRQQARARNRPPAG